MADQTSGHQLTAEIGLTLSQASNANLAGSLIQLHAGEFIAYETDVDCTRVRLTGRRVIMVKESTELIDHLLRQAQMSCTILDLSIGAKQQKAA
jgi:hypothetical protein